MVKAKGLLEIYNRSDKSEDVIKAIFSRAKTPEYNCLHEIEKLILKTEKQNGKNSQSNQAYKV